jgi:hypothetical protein
MVDLPQPETPIMTRTAGRRELLSMALFSYPERAKARIFRD